MNKRSFIKKAALAGIGLNLGMDALARHFDTRKEVAAADLASDEAFWKKIRKDYLLKIGRAHV